MSQVFKAISHGLGMINQLPGEPMRGIGIAPVSIQSLPDAPQPSRELYNTLYTITAGETPTVERTIPKLWHVRSWDGMSSNDRPLFSDQAVMETDREHIK